MRTKALLVAILLPLGAAAQEAAPPMPQDPRAPRFDEVERGFFTGFEVGFLALFNTRAADPTRYPFAAAGGGTATGFLVGTTVGYDLTDRFAVSLFALSGNASGRGSYGAFSVLATGGDLRLALFASRDGDGVPRLFGYLHGRAGYLTSYPEGLFGSSDLYVAGGPGIEYFTRLRHFSIGISADVAYVAKAKSAGIAVTPTMRYTF